MQTRKALKRLGGKDTDLFISNPAALEKFKAVAEADASRIEERKAQKSISQPHLDVLKNRVLATIDNDFNPSLPVVGRFDAYQSVKKLVNASSDHGVKALGYQLRSLWEADPTGVLTAGQLTNLKKHYAQSYGKTAAVDIISNALPKVGFVELPVQRLAVMASRIKTQADFDEACRIAGLAGNRPDQIRSRQYILALLKMGENVPEAGEVTEGNPMEVEVSGQPEGQVPGITESNAAEQLSNKSAMDSRVRTSRLPSANQVVEAALDAQTVKIAGWTLRVNDQDMVVIQSPTGGQRQARLSLIDKVASDFLKMAQSDPNFDPKVNQQQPDAVKGIGTGDAELGPDSDTEEGFKEPKPIQKHPAQSQAGTSTGVVGKTSRKTAAARLEASSTAPKWAATPHLWTMVYNKLKSAGKRTDYVSVSANYKLACQFNAKPYKTAGGGETLGPDSGQEEGFSVPSVSPQNINQPKNQSGTSLPDKADAEEPDHGQDPVPWENVKPNPKLSQLMPEADMQETAGGPGSGRKKESPGEHPAIAKEKKLEQQRNHIWNNQVGNGTPSQALFKANDALRDHQKMMHDQGIKQHPDHPAETFGKGKSEGVPGLSSTAPFSHQPSPDLGKPKPSTGPVGPQLPTPNIDEMLQGDPPKPSTGVPGLSSTAPFSPGVQKPGLGMPSDPGAQSLVNPDHQWDPEKGQYAPKPDMEPEADKHDDIENLEDQAINQLQTTQSLEKEVNADIVDSFVASLDPAEGYRQAKANRPSRDLLAGIGDENGWLMRQAQSLIDNKQVFTSDRNDIDQDGEAEVREDGKMAFTFKFDANLNPPTQRELQTYVNSFTGNRSAFIVEAHQIEGNHAFALIRQAEDDEMEPDDDEKRAAIRWAAGKQSQEMNIPQAVPSSGADNSGGMSNSVESQMGANACMACNGSNLQDVGSGIQCQDCGMMHDAPEQLPQLDVGNNPQGMGADYNGAILNRESQENDNAGPQQDNPLSNELQPYEEDELEQRMQTTPPNNQTYASKTAATLSEEWGDGGNYGRHLEADDAQDVHQLHRYMNGEVPDWSHRQMTPTAPGMTPPPAPMETESQVQPGAVGNPMKAPEPVPPKLEPEPEVQTAQSQTGGQYLDQDLAASVGGM